MLLPTKEISVACNALDVATQAFFKTRLKCRGYGHYESTVEALNLLNLATRHVQGVITSARTDLGMLPVALACARAALETSAKAAWMVDDNDPFIRETRWLVHLQEEERVYERSAKRHIEMGMSGETFLRRSAELRSFRHGVEQRLPKNTQLLTHNPTVDDLLESLGAKQLYPIYIYLSQYLHGGHTATWLYRRGLGTERDSGEYINPKHWFIPLRVAWFTLKETGGRALWRLGSGSREIMSTDAADEVWAAIKQTDSKPPTELGEKDAIEDS